MRDSLIFVFIFFYSKPNWFRPFFLLFIIMFLCIEFWVNVSEIIVLIKVKNNTKFYLQLTGERKKKVKDGDEQLIVFRCDWQTTKSVRRKATSAKESHYMRSRQRIVRCPKKLKFTKWLQNIGGVKLCMFPISEFHKYQRHAKSKCKWKIDTENEIERKKSETKINSKATFCLISCHFFFFSLLGALIFLCVKKLKRQKYAIYSQLSKRNINDAAINICLSFSLLILICRF